MDDEPEEMGIPEWVVTFGDMMSLLLTFFIMLVSLSEIKDEETYQKLVDSVQREFGYSRSADSLSPGKKRPRKTEFTPLATTGRAKRKDTSKGGVPVKAPAGEEPRVRIVRPGQLTAVVSVIFFEIGKATLSATARSEIKQLADKLRANHRKLRFAATFHQPMRIGLMTRSSQSNLDLNAHSMFDKPLSTKKASIPPDAAFPP